MAHTLTHSEPLATAVRWLARASTLPFLAVFILFGIGEGFPTPMALTAVEAVQFVFLFVTLAAMVAGWRYELTGGFFALAGILAFQIVNWSKTGHFAGGPVFPFMVVPGSLLLLSAMMHRVIRR